MTSSHLSKNQGKKQVYYRLKNYSKGIKVIRFLTKHSYPSTHQIGLELGDGIALPQNRVLTIMNHLKENDYCEEYSKVFSDEHSCQHCKKSFHYLLKRESLDFALEENQRRINRGNEFVSKEGHVLDRIITMICDDCFKVQEPLDVEFKIKKRKNDFYKYWSLSNNGLFVALSLLRGKSLEKFILSNQDNTTFQLLKLLLSSQNKNYVDNLISELKHTIYLYPDLGETVKRWNKQMNVILSKSKFDKKRYPELVEYVDEIKQREFRLNMSRGRKGHF